MSNVDHRPQGWQELRGEKNLSRLILVCFGVWLHAGEFLLVTTMIPNIIGDIGGARLVSWMVSL